MAQSLWGDGHALDPLENAVGALRAGEIVAYPTDTLYGLAVDPRLDAAVERLCRAKDRKVGDGFPLIAGDLEQVESFVGGVSDLGRRLAGRFWPGPLTLVLSAQRSVVSGLADAEGSLAIRVPASVVARQFALLAKHPITATSANRRGMAPATTGREVVQAFGSDVALVLEHQTTLVGAPSTIVDARAPTPRLIRDGVVPWTSVLQFLA